MCHLSMRYRGDDALFAMKPITQEAIMTAAKEIGLDMEAFERDISSEATKQRLMKDLVDAQGAEVRGTPSLFVNGRKVNDRSTAGIQRLIDEELAKAAK